MMSHDVRLSWVHALWFFNLNLILPVLFVATNIGSCDSVCIFIHSEDDWNACVAYFLRYICSPSSLTSFLSSPLLTLCNVSYILLFLHIFTFLHVLCIESYLWVEQAPASHCCFLMLLAYNHVCVGCFKYMCNKVYYVIHTLWAFENARNQINIPLPTAL